MRYLRFLLKSSCLFCVAAAVLYHFGDFERSRLQSQINRLEEEKTELRQFVTRLRGSRRVAQVEVVNRYSDATGRMVNRLQWQEVAGDGTLSPPRFLTALGRQVYFEGMVIKFDYDHVQSGDVDKGQSLVLFRRVFGDQEPAESAPEFERHRLPASAVSRGPAGRLAQLWRRFWELIDDPAMRSRYGVRVAQCEAPSVCLKEGQVWQLELAAAGGLDILKLADTRRPSDYWVPNPTDRSPASYPRPQGHTEVSE